MERTWAFDLAGIPAGMAVWPGRISIPIPRGEVYADFQVQRPDGSPVPAQARTRVPWPDGSPRWVQLDFQANGAGRHIVRAGRAASGVVLPLQVKRTGSAVTVSVGRLRVTLDPAAGDPVRGIHWEGHALAGTAEFGVVRVTDDEGRVYAPAGVEAWTVEAEGPQRLQVSWETEHRDAAGRRSLDARFRVEFLAGVEGFRLTYQFFHRLPGHDYLPVRRLDAAFALSGLGDGRALVVQPAHSMLGQNRVARVNHAVPILIDATQARAHVDDVACLDDDFAYPPFYSSQFAVGSAVALEGKGVAMTAAMRFLEDQRPKTVDVAPGVVAVGIWPERAGLLRLPQGRSSQHRFAFLFTGPDAVDALLVAPDAAYLEPAPGWLHAADSAAAGATWDAPRLFTGKEPGAGLFHDYIARATARYQVAGAMFDFGDSPHNPYSNTYNGLGMRPHGEKPTREWPFAAGLGGGIANPLPSLVPVQTMRPVWANNEYDAIYGLALQALRTRSLAVLRKLTAVARHQIEVDFVHYSDHWQQHRGTPCHTFDHTACSTAYPSHQWTQGLYYYYCMTGDDDVPEVVRAICDYNLRWLAEPGLQLQHYFNRELGWAVMAYVFGYELTGDARYRDAARDLIRELARIGQGDDFGEQFGKSGAYVAPNERQLGTCFAVNTILMGVCLYHKATGEEWARALLERWVHVGFANYNDKATGPKVVDMFPECIAYLHELTGDPRLLEESLWAVRLFMLGYANPWGMPNSHGIEPLDGKLYGRVYRGLVHNISACARAGLLPRLEAQFVGV
jgi:hypothetical protein